VGSRKFTTHISGGVSNVSFSFRGNDAVRGNALCFLVSCHSKRNDNGDCKSGNVVDMMRFPKIYWSM
jgi:cobalamin-dependent methionine synthase I